MKRTATVAALGVATFIALSACSGGSTALDPTTTVAETTTTNNVATFQAWGRQNLELIKDLSTALQGVDDANATEDLAKMTAACLRVTAATQTAREAPPIPVAKYDVHWQTALQLFAEAGQACASAAQLQDPSQASTSTELFNQGAAELGTVIQALQSGG